MSYVNKYYKAGINATNIYKVVAIGKDTYVIGNTIRNKSNEIELYIARIDESGTMLWERSYYLPKVLNGKDFWNQFHVEDLIYANSKEFVGLAYNLNEVFIFTLNNEKGYLESLRKVYDKNDVSAPYGNLNIKARLHDLRDNTVIINIHEIHSDKINEVKNIDYHLIRYSLERQYPLFAKKIENYGEILLTIREEEMRSSILHLFGGVSTKGGAEPNLGIIIMLDKDLNVIQSTTLCYEKESELGSDNIDIFWTSPVYKDSYLVKGSYHRFRPKTVFTSPIKKWLINLSDRPIKFKPIKFPILIDWIPVKVELSERYTHYFIAEINRETNSIIRSVQMELDFSESGDKTVHLTSEGPFVSLDRSFFKLKEDLLSSEWCKEIKTSEEIQSFIPHRSIRRDNFYAFLDADSQTREDIAFYLAETPLTFQTCQTKSLEDNLKFNELPLILDKIEIYSVEAKVNFYETPELKESLENLETERLCGSSEEVLPIGPGTRLQSEYLYIQAVGSTGIDSTSGIHVRWQFKKNLLEHLPKGPYYTGVPQGLNQSNDYVKILRAPYQVVQTLVDFSKSPTSVNDSFRQWTYLVNEKTIYITFRNSSKYTQVRASINPINNPLGFIQAYGDNLIELNCYTDEFFSFRYVTSNQNGNIRTEVLSVESHAAQSARTTSFRKKLNGVELSKLHLIENGRSLRFQPSGLFTQSIALEFYTDFISLANQNGLWQSLGEYSLSLNDNEVYRRLEPNSGSRPVHAKWPRYNGGEYVNSKNYIEKWNGSLPDPRNRIKNSVEQYIDRSNDITNPLANEIYYLNDVIDPSGGMEVSHLNLLQMASMDFHVARMLGLGLSDFSNEVYNGTRYIYAAVYKIQAVLPGGGNELVAVSLPTNINDVRPPLPLDLKEAIPGIFTSTGEVGVLSPLTNPDGYSVDGKTRYISLFSKELVPNEPPEIAFYWSSQEFNLSEMTYPVFAGLKYKTSESEQWLSPELSHDVEYRNVTNQGALSGFETVVIPVPDFGLPLYIHKITRSGQQIYGSYGIDWFSRGKMSSVIKTEITNIKAQNELMPPSACNALLIQEESPLMLTSEKEQEIYSGIDSNDKTFVRLTFEYDSAQEMVSYLCAVNGIDNPDFDPMPINEEIFANEIEIFFKPELPKQFFGSILSVENDSNNPLVSIITTGPMELNSAGQTLYPNIPTAEISHYIGSVFKTGSEEFIIHQIEPNSSNPLLPIFHVLKKQASNPFEFPTDVLFDSTDFIVPEEGNSFMIVENMLNEVSWENNNPHSFKVDVGSMWDIHEEEVIITAEEGSDITSNSYYRRFRGFMHDSIKITKFQDEFSPNFQGMYVLIFEGFHLAHHPQFNAIIGESSVDWYGGSVRIPYQDNPEGERKILKILKFEKVGSGEDLIVYALDETFEQDPLQIDESRTVKGNLYPGYRCYIYRNENIKLTQEHIYPQDENILDKYSIFGFRSRISGDPDFISAISVPTMMFARRHDKPEQPEQPAGGIFATRPDFYGRSTFTFNTKYIHKPFALSFVRTNDDLLLSSLYRQTPYGQTIEKDSVEDIRKNNDDNNYNNRLLDLANGTVDIEYLFPMYNGYRFPIPNNEYFYKEINQFIEDHNLYYNDNLPNITLDMIDRMNYVVIPEVSGRNEQLLFIDFVRQTIRNSFLPLTELPIIYNYIKGDNYQPHPGLQVVRDRNGILLKPEDADFDMAPMVKILSTDPHKTQFTDFTLDGNSRSVYFYAVREMNSQMQQGALSSVIGPIRMVNSYAIYAPEIVSIVPVLKNKTLNIEPSVNITINAYDSIRNIRKLKLYRTFESLKANDVRSMDLIKTIDLEVEGLINNPTWTIKDDFSDLSEIPYSDPLFYRVLVEAEIKYAQANYNYDESNPNNTFDIITDYAPGEPSKLIVTTIVENQTPDAPLVSYTAQLSSNSLLSNVIFRWEKQAYKANYYLYKMNSQGNWVQIAKVNSNEEVINLELINTDWNSDQLVIKNNQGNTIYHHFKILTENTSGMFSTDEIVLTIPNE